MRSFVILSLALLLCLPAAGQNAGTDELVASALQSLVAESSTNLQSYRFFLDMEQDIDLASLSSNDSQRLVTRSFGFGAANMTDKALKLSLVALTYDRDDASNSSIIALEEYLVNDTIYMKLDGNWTALKMPSVADAWSSQSTMNQHLQILNQSRLILQGSESVEDLDCYKVLAEMDQGTVADQLSGEAASLLPELDMNFREIFSNASLTATYWIDKESHNLKKADVLESFIINPRSLGLSSEESGAVEMRINSEVSMLFQGYNDSIEIKLPVEAESAAAFSADLLAGGEASPVALTVDESPIDESVQNTSISKPVQNLTSIPAANQTLNQAENQAASQISLENNRIQAAAQA